MTVSHDLCYFCDQTLVYMVLCTVRCRSIVNTNNTLLTALDYTEVLWWEEIDLWIHLYYITVKHSQKKIISGLCILFNIVPMNDYLSIVKADITEITRICRHGNIDIEINILPMNKRLLINSHSWHYRDKQNFSVWQHWYWNSKQSVYFSIYVYQPHRTDQGHT